MTISKHIPKRRFKEFVSEDGWVSSKFLDNISQIIDFRGRTPKKLGMDWSKEGYLALSALNVKNGYIDKTIESHFGDEELYNKWMSGKELQKNQVIFTTEAPMGNVAQIPDENKYILSQRTIAFKVNDSKIIDDFLAVLLRSKSTFDSLLSLTSGGTAKGVSQKSLEELSVFIPNNLKEQTFISIFLKKIDTLITLHQHKLDKLKNLKKSYLAELFPAEGERVPKRRFPGFEGEWEKKKLGEIMDVGSVKRVHQSDWRVNGVRFLRARDIVSEFKNEVSNDYLYIDEELYKAYTTISGKVEKGDVLVTGVGTIGVPLLIKSDEPLYFKDGNIIWFKNKNKIDGYFFYYSFIGNTIQKFIGDVAGIGTVGTYTIDSGKNTPILLPKSKEEQILIGNFLKKLDNSITLQRQKLDKLKDLKKAYLNELFV
ncbi:restriction endonuclease subunit S [Streptococcus parasanguinis]|uniref:restriction endonuclease subunit S n=1 Tax=Streptococcus parasanguinis TaxID=1318 RepID=UPI0039C3FD26